MRICAHSVRILCACAPTSVEVLGFFLFAHSNAHRLLCSPLRTDVGAHAHRLRTDCAQMRTAAVRILTDVCAHLHRSDMQFRTDHSIPHRPNSSPLLTDAGAHVHHMRTDAHRRRCASSPLDIQFLTDDLLRPPLLQPRPIFTVFYGNKAQKPVKRSILITNIKYPTRYETSQYLTI